MKKYSEYKGDKTRCYELMHYIKEWSYKNIKSSYNGYWLSKEEMKASISQKKVNKFFKGNEKEQVLKQINNHKFKEGAHLSWFLKDILYVLDVPDEDLEIPTNLKHNFPNRDYYVSGMEKLVYEEDD